MGDHEHAACERSGTRQPALWRRRGFWATIAVCVGAAALLAMWFPAQTWGILPYAVLLLCPFLHLFGHRGHRH